MDRPKSPIRSINPVYTGGDVSIDCVFEYGNGSIFRLYRSFLSMSICGSIISVDVSFFRGKTGYWIQTFEQTTSIASNIIFKQDYVVVYFFLSFYYNDIFDIIISNNLKKSIIIESAHLDGDMYREEIEKVGDFLN